MYRLASFRTVITLELVAIVAGAANAWLFATVIGPQVPKELEVYANTVALTLGVIWLFFSTSIWLRADEESKKVAAAIEQNDEVTFLNEAAKRVSPVVWLLYFQISALTLVGFDLFHVGPGAEVFAGILNFLIFFLVVTTCWINWDGDDSLNGIVVVHNAKKVKRDWLEKLNATLGKQTLERQS